jgi:hypothetical protein
MINLLQVIFLPLSSLIQKRATPNRALITRTRWILLGWGWISYAVFMLISVYCVEIYNIKGLKLAGVLNGAILHKCYWY